jgi:hypothetical protein
MNKGRMQDLLFPNLSEDIEDATTKLFDFNTEMQDFQNGFQRAMERAFHSQDRFFKAFIENLRLTVRQQFFSAISKGITSKIFSLAIPALTGLLTGGTSTLIGPTLQGAGVNIPFLPKMGRPQTVQVEGVIRGTDIFLSNARTSGNRLRSV